MEKKKLFSLQLFSGRLIAIFIWFLISVVQWSNNPKSDPGITIPLIVRAIEALSVLLVSEAVIFSIEKTSLFFRKRYRAVLLLFAALYLFSIAANVISLALRGAIGFTPPKVDGFFFIQSLHFYVPLCLVVAVHYMVKLRLDLITEKENKLKAEALAQQARWMMLRYQVNPHFLFNTLNSIRALIGNDDEKARKIVTEMSDYFRYSLSIEKKPLVQVKQEIDAVEHYLEIQKIRYPQRIEVSKEIDTEASECLIPVFSVQTLVENATKYGLKTHSGSIEIDIEVKKEEDGLLIRISNTGKLVEHAMEHGNGDGTNTGIANLKNRLEYLDKDYRFWLIEKGDKVIANIMLKVCREDTMSLSGTAP